MITLKIQVESIDSSAVGLLSVPPGLLDLSNDAGVHKPHSFPRCRWVFFHSAAHPRSAIDCISVSP
jgi:hypothetical protein